MLKKYLSFLVSVACLSTLFLLPQSVLADAPIFGMIDRASTVVGSAAIVIVVIGWTVVGIMFLSAVGSPERFSKAKKALFWVIIGTIVCILAVASIGIIKSTFGI